MSTQDDSPPKSIENSTVPSGECGNAEHQAAPTGLTTLAHHLKEPGNVIDDHHTNESNPDTKILYEGQDGKPTITLTAYKKDDSPGQSVLNTANAISDSCADGKKPHELEDELKCQLEDYFQGLKSEFKARTGREWDPLRSWPAEDWEWVWDDDEP
jgi:hypothetical protein